MRYGTDNFMLVPTACITSDGVYGVVNKVLIRLADSWDDLTEEEKVATMLRINGNLTMEHFLSLQKFRIVTMNDIETEQECNITAIKTSPVIFRPQELFSTFKYNCVKSFLSQCNVPSGCDIKVAVTNNFASYYVYNFNYGTWEEIDDMDPDEFMTKGIPYDMLGEINPEAWGMLNGEEGIGFAFALSMPNVYDNCGVDTLKVQAKEKGVWTNAVEGIDYSYSVPNDTTIRINLIKDGTYKTVYDPDA